MSAPGNRRDRQHEPSEQERARRQRNGRCITCGADANGRQRCRPCMQRIEAATDRDRGQGKRGRMPIIATDIRDLRFSAEELGKGYAGFTAVQMLGAMSTRKRDELLGEPLHHVRLAWGFLGEVLERAGLMPQRKARKSKVAKAESKPPSGPPPREQLD